MSGDPTILGALYRLGPVLLLELVWALLRGKPRSLAKDAGRFVAHMRPRPRLEGLDLVPPTDPFVLVGNHFQAPGLWVGWIAAAISSAVGQVRASGRRDLHWLVLSEWRWLELAGRWLPNPLTALIFPRASRVWGLVPTPSRPADVSGRARALRQILTYLGQRSPNGPAGAEPVAIFPEGTGTVGLAEARPGSGAFLYRLSGRGVPLLPVGTCQEKDGTLMIRFGRPFFMDAPPRGRPEERDRWLREQVMTAIGRLLPRELWGVYADAIARSGGQSPEPGTEARIGLPAADARGRRLTTAP